MPSSETDTHTFGVSDATDTPVGLMQQLVELHLDYNEYESVQAMLGYWYDNLSLVMLKYGTVCVFVWVCV